MGCTTAVEVAIRGERGQKFATERTTGDAVLDRIDNVSRMVREKKATIEMKRERKGWKQSDAPQAPQEEIVEQADWWSGGGGQATVMPPVDETPFQADSEDDYDYDYDWEEDYDAEIDWNEDYDYTATWYDAEDAGEPQILAPDFAQSPRPSPMPSPRSLPKLSMPSPRTSPCQSPRSPRARAATSPSPSPRSPRPRASSSSRGAVKQTTSTRKVPKRNDPWGSSSDSDQEPTRKSSEAAQHDQGESEGNAKVTRKAKSKADNDSSSSEAASVMATRSTGIDSPSWFQTRMAGGAPLRPKAKKMTKKKSSSTSQSGSRRGSLDPMSSRPPVKQAKSGKGKGKGQQGPRRSVGSGPRLTPPSPGHRKPAGVVSDSSDDDNVMF